MPATSDDPYVIVTETYPTNYGCNRGRNWNRAEMICRTDVDISSEQYDSHAAAVKAARKARDRSDWFCDYEHPDEDDLPPYDSAEMENWDNDEEILIRVMKQSEIDKERENDQQYLETAREKAIFEAALKSEMIKIQVKDSGGKVFYSHRYKDSQIPAEYEFDEEKDMPFVLPAYASDIKTIMYKVNHKKNYEVIRGDKEALFESDLMKLLVACTSLEELYLQCTGFNCTIDTGFFEGVLAKAPHLSQTLKVFSINMFDLPPWVLEALPGFANLTRLDVSDCFQTEYCNDFEASVLPYDEPLIECLGNLPHLKRLDLGNGDPESRRYLHDYSLGHSALHNAKNMVDLVTLENDNLPDPFSSSAREKAARKEALNQIVQNASGKYSEGVIKLAQC